MTDVAPDSAVASATPTANAAPATPEPSQQGSATSTPYAPAATPQAPAEATIPASVLRYRLQETRDAAVREAQSQWATKEAQYEAQLEQIQRQLHALVGATPQQDTETETVRRQFGQLYPGLSQLEQRAADLMAILERSGDLESQNKHYWQSYGRQTMDRLFEKASSSLGGQLSPEAKRSLHAAFTGYIQSSPDLTTRYTQDPSLVDEFWTNFTSTFIDPARRTATATVAGRAAQVAPQDTPGATPPVQQAPKPANLDERVTNAWAQYNAAKRSPNP